MVVRIGALLCNSFTSGFQENLTIEEAVSLNNESPSFLLHNPFTSRLISLQSSCNVAWRSELLKIVLAV